jgi:hypothetical protein
MDVLNFAKIVPDWMNQSFFEKVVKEMEKDSSATLQDFKVAAGSNPGDNFASSIYRGKIEFKSKFTGNETKSVSLIIKTQITSSLGFHEFIKDSPMFRNEMEMYSKVLPEIQALLLSVGDKDLLCPKYVRYALYKAVSYHIHCFRLIYQTNDPAPTIILEDVSCYGFDVVQKPIEDFEVSKHIARRLGKFHAANFFLYHEQVRRLSWQLIFSL